MGLHVFAIGRRSATPALLHAIRDGGFSVEARSQDCYVVSDGETAFEMWFGSGPPLRPGEPPYDVTSLMVTAGSSSRRAELIDAVMALCRERAAEFFEGVDPDLWDETAD